MELEQAIEYAKHPEKIIDIEACNYASSLVGGWITDLEEQLWEADLALNHAWGVEREKNATNHATDKKVAVMAEFATREAIKRQLAQMKRLRADLKGRYEILISMRRF